MVMFQLLTVSSALDCK